MDFVWMAALALLWAAVVAGAFGLSSLDRAQEPRP